MDDLTMNQQELAALLQTTTRTLQKMTAQHILPREKDGAYNVHRAVAAYLQHKGGEYEARQQRTALVRQQTIAANLRSRRQLGDLVERGTLRDFCDILDDVATRLWSALSSGLYHNLRNVEGLGDADARRIVNEADGVAKDELAVLRQRLRLMVEAARDDLRQDDRLDRLQAWLAGEPVTPPKKAKK